MSLDRHTSDEIRHIIRELADEGVSSLRPGVVLDRLRELGRPVGAWDMRSEFARLTEEGFLKFDPELANWTLTHASPKPPAK